MLLTPAHRAAHCVPQDWHHEPGSDFASLLILQDGYCELDPVERSTVSGMVGAGGGGGMFDAGTT